MIIRNDAIHLISFALRDGRRMTDVSLNRPLTVFYFNHFYYWQESGYTKKQLFHPDCISIKQYSLIIS